MTVVHTESRVSKKNEIWPSSTRSPARKPHLKTLLRMERLLSGSKTPTSSKNSTPPKEPELQKTGTTTPKVSTCKMLHRRLCKSFENVARTMLAELGSFKSSRVTSLARKQELSGTYTVTATWSDLVIRSKGIFVVFARWDKRRSPFMVVSETGQDGSTQERFLDVREVTCKVRAERYSFYFFTDETETEVIPIKSTTKPGAFVCTCSRENIDDENQDQNVAENKDKALLISQTKNSAGNKIRNEVSGVAATTKAKRTAGKLQIELRQPDLVHRLLSCRAKKLNAKQTSHSGSSVMFLNSAEESSRRQSADQLLHVPRACSSPIDDFNGTATSTPNAFSIQSPEVTSSVEDTTPDVRPQVQVSEETRCGSDPGSKGAAFTTARGQGSEGKHPQSELQVHHETPRTRRTAGRRRVHWELLQEEQDRGHKSIPDTEAGLQPFTSDFKQESEVKPPQSVLEVHRETSRKSGNVGLSYVQKEPLKEEDDRTHQNNANIEKGLQRPRNLGRGRGIINGSQCYSPAMPWRSNREASVSWSEGAAKRRDQFMSSNAPSQSRRESDSFWTDSVDSSQKTMRPVKKEPVGPLGWNSFSSSGQRSSKWHSSDWPSSAERGVSGKDTLSESGFDENSAISLLFSADESKGRSTDSRDSAIFESSTTETSNSCPLQDLKNRTDKSTSRESVFGRRIVGRGVIRICPASGAMYICSSVFNTPDEQSGWPSESSLLRM